MIELKTYKFSDLYEMSSGISSKPEQAGHGTPFLSFSTVFNNQVLPDVLPDLMDVSLKEQKTYSILEGDIFLTRTSETLDELGMSSVAIRSYPEATYSGFLKRLRPIQKGITYPKFMAFYLRSKLFRKTMSNNAIMTLRASLNEQIFSYLDLLLPPYDVQKEIGDYLFSTLEKEKLNNKINVELEGMAKLLYDYWFVQFDFPMSEEQAEAIGKPATAGRPYKSSGGKMVYNETLKREIPEGWEVKKLKEFAKTGSGGTPLKSKPEYYEDGTIPWINSGEVNAPFIVSAKKFITQEGLKESSAKLFAKGTILMAMYGATAGKVSFMDIEACTNQAVCAVMPTADFYKEFVKLSLEDLYQYLVSLSSGSARDNLSQDKIKELKFAMPPDFLLKEFHQKVNSSMLQILLNMKQNQKLSALRDWLLPMLMNGQVTVGEGLSASGFSGLVDEQDLSMMAEDRGEYGK